MSEEASQDSSNKTEEATQKRLDDALKEGKVVNSREITNFLLISTFTIAAIYILPNILGILLAQLRLIIETAGEIEINPSNLGLILKIQFGNLLFYFSSLFILLAFISIFSSFMQQGGFIISTSSLELDLSKLSLLKGIKRIFSTKNFVELLKNIFKISFVGVFVYLVIVSDIKALRMYHSFSVQAIIQELVSIISHILISVCITMCVIAMVDYFYQRFEYFSSLMMSKQDIKDEIKDTEGNQEIKRKQRSIRQSRRIMNSILTPENTDVVITNPEHFAIALKYIPGEMLAPKVIAKGMDLIALDIKTTAQKNYIPIIENPPLARALYKESRVNDYIPVKHYEAIAKIISYVFSLKK